METDWLIVLRLELPLSGAPGSKALEVPTHLSCPTHRGRWRSDEELWVHYQDTGGMFGGSLSQDGSMPSEQWEHGDKRDPHERNRKVPCCWQRKNNGWMTDTHKGKKRKCLVCTMPCWFIHMYIKLGWKRTKLSDIYLEHINPTINLCIFRGFSGRILPWVTYKVVIPYFIMKSSEVLILWFPFTELHSCGVIKGDTPKAPLAFPSLLCFCYF